MKKSFLIGIVLSVSLLMSSCAFVRQVGEGKTGQEILAGTGESTTESPKVDERLEVTEVSMETLCEPEGDLGKCQAVAVTQDGVFRIFAVSGLYGYMEYYEAEAPITDLTLQTPVRVRSAVRNSINYSDAMTLSTRISGTVSAAEGQTGGLYCYAYCPDCDYGTYEFIAGTAYPDYDTLQAKETDVCLAGMCNVLWASRGTGKQVYGVFEWS